mmetsp:Transcript_2209/g.7371  ORF Transcript_2209/g.7371 Transcript_2209/m.7371 type:complete len:288 (+) Transcript_2209:824-1687(+)
MPDVPRMLLQGVNGLLQVEVPHHARAVVRGGHQEVGVRWVVHHARDVGPVPVQRELPPAFLQVPRNDLAVRVAGAALVVRLAGKGEAGGQDLQALQRQVLGVLPPPVPSKDDDRPVLQSRRDPLPVVGDRAVRHPPLHLHNPLFPQHPLRPLAARAKGVHRLPRQVGFAVSLRVAQGEPELLQLVYVRSALGEGEGVPPAPVPLLRQVQLVVQDHDPAAVLEQAHLGVLATSRVVRVLPLATQALRPRGPPRGPPLVRRRRHRVRCGALRLHPRVHAHAPQVRGVEG